MPALLRAPIVAIFAFVLCGSNEAWAESSRVENFLVIAEDAFLDVEYEDALEALDRAESLGEASPRQTASILALRGTIYFLLENEAQARSEYLRLLNINSGYELPETHPPRASQFLDSVRGEVSASISIDHEPPRAFNAGDPLVINADIHGFSEGYTAQVFYRPYGESGYSSAEMTRVEGDRFVGEIPPGGPIDVERGGIVEYFVMISAGEERLTNEGSPRNPLSFEIRGEDGQTPNGGTPVVRRWWFWTIIGLAVGAGLGFGLGFGLNVEEEIPTGTVDLTLRFETE